MPNKVLTTMLTEGTIHVFYALFNDFAKNREHFTSFLSHDEMEQAGCYLFEKDRSSFIIRRGILRSILGGYLGKNPSLISYQKGSYGKLYLDCQDSRINMTFNLSFSHALAVFAFTLNRVIGIDIEYNRPIQEGGQIACNYFSEYENKELATLLGDQYVEGFYNCWTRKEAYVKAIGQGLAFPLDQFDVSLIPGRPAQLLRINGKPQEKKWCMKDLAIPIDNYTAALVCECKSCSITLYRYNSSNMKCNFIK